MVNLRDRDYGGEAPETPEGKPANSGGSAGATRLSIIMPCFNARATIERAIDSVLSQDYPVHELIIQDGASRDGTLEILRKYGSPVSVISEPDHGQSDALNRALKQVTGDAVGWLNADDFYTKGAFRPVAEAFDRHPEVDFVYGDFALLDAAGRRIRRYYVSQWDWSRLFLHGLYLFSGATFFRRDLFDSVGDFNTRLHYTMDLEFFLRLGPSTRAVHVPEVLGAFTAFETSKSSTVPFQFLREAREVYREYAQDSARLRIAVLIRLARGLAYVSTRPIWRSRIWSRLRPDKRL